jgi:iron complex transport system ATP-binding protein
MTLELRGLAFGYPGRPIGRDVECRVAQGEVLCLLGPNGSGKTTLSRTILGLLAPRAGTVAVDGATTQGWSPRRRGRVFGYVPQAQPAAFAFTVRDLVLMGRTPHLGLFAAPGPRDRALADAALATLGIEGLAGRSCGELSGGERQLSLVARAIAQEARILVLDEPTANLDLGNQVRVLSALRALAARGLAVLDARPGSGLPLRPPRGAPAERAPGGPRRPRRDHHGGAAAGPVRRGGARGGGRRRRSAPARLSSVAGVGEPPIGSGSSMSTRAYMPRPTR